MPRVSVLMPLFNGKTYIEESLQSIQNQTYTDWEFIIVNDYGSNDGCADIIKRYAEKDSRILLIQAQERLGLAASLNVGLDAAKGEYIARVDVDDPSEPTRLEKQVNYMDAHPEITVCGCWQRSITPTGADDQIVASDPNDLEASMMFGCELSHCGVMLRKKEFDKNHWRYDPSYLGEDFELWNRIIAAGGKIANIPEVLVSHRWGFENISIEKGERLRKETRSINMRTIARLGVDVNKYVSVLFSGWRNRPEEYAKNCREIFLKQGFHLITEILERNRVLHAYDEAALRKTMFYRWNWIRQSCGLKFEKFPYTENKAVGDAPMVSVVMPTFRSVNDISISIDSVINQTVKDWELLVINDAESDDGTAEIVKMYSMFDSRIQLIQAEERLGLAESINYGMRLAKGKYIARLDADDTAHADRFEKQLALMESRPDVGLCGTWQHHYGPNCDWVHRATADEDLLKTRLIFWCDLCHSTLMLRKDVFIQNNLFYNPEWMAEDYELWTRVIKYTHIVNIPEVLGEYKEDGTSITAKKFNALHLESGKISAKVLKETLDIDLTDQQAMLLNGWMNPHKSRESKEEALKQLKPIFEEIWRQNNKIGFFEPNALLQTLAAKWYWIKYDTDWKSHEYHLSTLEQIFNDDASPTFFERYQQFKENNPKFSTRVKKVIKKACLQPVAAVYRKFLRKSYAWIIDELKQNVEDLTWNRYERTKSDINALKKQIAQIDHDRTEYVPYYEGSKIRIVFLFQVASFWPSQEQLYFRLLEDERFDVKLVCYDDGFDKSIKTETAREYLEANHYKFTPWEVFSIDDFNPHVVVLQTAYDTNRKPPYTSKALSKKGRRVVYVPYGIEIADTLHAREDHFRLAIMDNVWRVYTLSDAMQQEYHLHLNKKVAVQAFGLPRFDALYKREFAPNEEIRRRANGRKIVLWKVHFPKVIKEYSKNILVTPDIAEYLIFADMIKQMSDIFFVFMPHPRFKEFNADRLVREQTLQLVSMLEGVENVYIDDADDYRPSLFMADGIIVDRSAVMIEAAAVNVPVLYMYNEKYDEPMTKAVQPLIDSYYQGTTYQDMIAFIDQMRNNQDPKREQREAAFSTCVPFYDGKCSERIADDIASGVMNELTDANLANNLESVKEEITDELKTSVERWTWNRYERTKSDINVLKKQITQIECRNVEYVPYYAGSKIRIVFLFQVASFWPSQEQLYFQVLQDERFDVKLVCYDDDFDKSIKTETAMEYLSNCQYNFVPWQEFDIDDYNPHVVVIQTPYDSNRMESFKSDTLRRNGVRVVYIPYGLEIGDTPHSHVDQFTPSIIYNTWRVYILSDSMKEEYKKYLKHPVSLKTLGLPRFDSLYNKKQFAPNEEIVKRANGRKVVLWKVHFPKIITQNDTELYLTPDICEYLAFSNVLDQMKDIFFIFMPHPRFKEFNADPLVREQTLQLLNMLEGKENVYIDNADDYRPSLFMADAIIVDRSAVMVEAATVGVPILYMYNKDYQEPLTNAIKPLVDSYYQGTTCKDMIAFVEQVRQNQDPKKMERQAAFSKCIPFYDGMCSKRIADDIACGVMNDCKNDNDINLRLQKLEEQTALILENQMRIEAYLSQNNKDISSR